jgi:catechol 2,3-dioxygenase-like lactoylglutathione lyase family enzyme
MARIKHIAIRTGDPEKTAKFYQETFGLKRAGLGKNGIYLTDGHLNLAILKGGEKLGIEHLGFQVDDVDQALARVAEHGGKPLGDRVNVTPSDAHNPQSYFEIKCLGPDDQIIDVSSSGWVGTD